MGAVHDQIPPGHALTEAPTTTAARVPWRSKLAARVGHNLHFFTFLPLVIISVLQDINLLLAAVLCTSLVLLNLTMSLCCYKAGVVKVFPKPFDIFNLLLYGSMVPLAVCAHDWLLMYVGLLTNGANAAFMWATILLPWDNFVMHSVRDRVPQPALRSPLIKRMALLIALVWAVALSLMTAGAIIPIAARLHPTQPHPGNMVATYVLGFGPLLLALPLQFLISHVYRRRLQQQYEAQREQHGEQLLSGGPAGGPAAGAVTVTGGGGAAGSKCGDQAGLV